MNDDQLRALVRAAIAQHMAASPAPAGHPRPAGGRAHASHVIVSMLPDTTDTDPCLIEPAVLCNHCGYCKSYGH